MLLLEKNVKDEQSHNAASSAACSVMTTASNKPWEGEVCITATSHLTQKRGLSSS